MHAHGRVIGSAGWALRGRVGAEVADRVIFKALDLFNLNTTHEEAAELIVAMAEEEGEAVAAAAREVLDEHGMIRCDRSA